MAGSCWRLLAALSLIFVAPVLLRGQDTVEDRVPVLAPELGMLRHSPLLGPVRFPMSPNFPRPSPVAPGTLVFQQIVGAAGIIFSGRVTAIGRVPLAPGQGPSSTTVTFQVERAMRGSSPGQILTIHEWAGLWTSGERYHVGESVLLFLYPPGKLGLTSPVAGAMGRFALDSRGRILMNGRHSANSAADPILGGKTVVPYADFALAVRRSSREE
jgi:hypothetical protein